MPPARPGAEAGDITASAPRRVTPSEVAEGAAPVDQPGRLRDTAMEEPRRFGSNVVTDKQDRRRAATSDRVGAELPRDRRDEEFDADMTFTEEEGQAVADEFEADEAERTRRSGMSLMDLVDEASEGAVAQESTVTDEAVELALDRLGQGDSVEEAAEAAAEETSEEPEEATPMTPEERAAQEARDSEARLRRIFAISQAIRGLGAVIAGVGGGSAAAQSLSEAVERANQAEMQRVQSRAERMDRRAQQARDEAFRTRQLDQSQAQFEAQQELRERQEERAEREFGLSSEQAALQNEMTRLEIAAQEQGNALVSQEELARIYSVFSSAGRTGTMTRDEFMAQEITNRELNDTLDTRFPVPRRGARSGRRRGTGRGRGTGTGSATTPAATGADDLYAGQVDMPSRWTNRQIEIYNGMNERGKSAIHAGYRPPGWFGEGSEAVNPEFMTGELPASEERIEQRRLAGERTREAISAARGQDQTRRIVNSYMPRAGRVLGAQDGNEVQILAETATVEPDVAADHLRTYANSNAAVNAYNNAYARLQALTENDVNLRRAALERSPNDFIAMFGESDDEGQRLAAEAMADLSAAGSAAISLIREAENWGAVTLSEREQVEQELGSPDNPINMATGRSRQNAQTFFNSRMRDLIESQRRYLFGGPGQPAQIETVPNTFTFIGEEGQRVTGVPRNQMRALIRQIMERYPDSREANRRIVAMDIQRTAR